MNPEVTQIEDSISKSGGDGASPTKREDKRTKQQATSSEAGSTKSENKRKSQQATSSETGSTPRTPNNNQLRDQFVSGIISLGLFTFFSSIVCSSVFRLI